MKKILLTASLLCFSTFFAQASDNKNTIHVTGMAEMQLPADMGVIDVALKIHKKTASEASKENARIMENIREIWSKDGFATNNIITKNYRLFPRTKYNKVKGRSEPDGFEVSHELKFKVMDPKRLGDAADLLVRNGMTHINNMRFEPKKTHKHYEELLKAAIQDAREKAKIIIDSVGGTALSLKHANIQHHNDNNHMPRPVMMRSMAMAEDSAPKTNIRTEGKTIRATVKTQWNFIP